MNAEADPSASPLLESGAPKGEAALAGILFHGRDRTREDKIVLASNFGASGNRWRAPAADAGSWYPGRFFEPRAANEPFLTDAIAQLDRVVEEAADSGGWAPSCWEWWASPKGPACPSSMLFSVRDAVPR